MRIADTLTKSIAIIDGAAAGLHFVTNNMDDADGNTISPEYTARLLYGIATSLEDISEDLGEAEANLMPDMEHSDMRILVEPALLEELVQLADDTDMPVNNLLDAAISNFLRAKADADAQQEEATPETEGATA